MYIKSMAHVLGHRGKVRTSSITLQIICKHPNSKHCWDSPKSFWHDSHAHVKLSLLIALCFWVWWCHLQPAFTTKFYTPSTFLALLAPALRDKTAQCPNFSNNSIGTESNKTSPAGSWEHLGRPWKRVLDFELMLECYSIPKLYTF